MWIVFDCIFVIYALAYLPYLLITRRLYAGFAMRFGFIPLGIKESIRRRQNIWVHAVSVGEVIVIEGLIAHLNALYPNYQIITTVTTKTGYDLALKRLAGKAIVLPSPLDFSAVVGHFIRLIKPKLYVAAETEIWPNLLMALESKRIPTMIINGRISDNSFKRYNMIRGLLKPVLETIDIAGMQSELDAKRITAMGARPEAVKVLGNIKFDDVPAQHDVAKADYGLDPTSLVLIAGSTHPGEEEIMIKAYARIHERDARWTLVIAPRHIERADDVVRLINEAGFDAIKFTQLNSNTQRGQAVLVLDTIGHLRSLYALADIVFVGNSLRAGGGHNIIEPACYAKPIIVGPLMSNFRDIMRCFRDANGVIEVEHEEDLYEQVAQLANDEVLRRQWGQRAKQVIEVHQGTTRRTVELMKQWLS